MTFEFNLPIPFSICFWFIQAFLAPKHPAWIESKLRNGMELNQTVSNILLIMNVND